MLLPLRRVWIAQAAAFVGWALCADNNAAEPAGQAAAAPKQQLPEIPGELIDEAFIAKVDLAAVRDAIGALDAKALMGHAEKLLLAERQLGKKHKSLNFAGLVDLAIRIVTDDHDQEAFESIVKMLAHLGVRDFDDKLAAIKQQIQERPRKISPGPNVPLSETTSDAIVLYNALIKQIRVAKMVGDRRALSSMRQKIQGTAELHVKQRQHLILLCDDAIASLMGDTSKESATLSKLSATLYLP